ncbi:MAG: Stp1/IreP family PP2C-type Ser/Thr phosphatase [Lachnospiraceae bacterium]|nr:Stp1/IreP family PP2C-type Ser/Thr phosphatase [Lachnospiraceae bacterium]
MQTSVAMTDIGRRRKINQDYVYASDQPVGNLPNLYIVADGMGGHRAGDLASSYAVKMVVEAVERCMDERPALILQKAVRYANYQLYRMALEHEEYHGMGTTLVALSVNKEEALALNIGDSRLYEVTGQGIRQISEDHSLVAELVRKGELDPREARNHPDKNIITRALGIQEEVEVDLFLFQVEQGSRYLLCSDGLSNMVEDTELCRLIQKDRKLYEIGGRLILEANKNGGTDNIAVVLVEIE